MPPAQFGRRRDPGRAEELPFPDSRFDAALAQLVLHFVSDPAAAARELRRVVRPGGIVGACVWDVDGMAMLRLFQEAVRATNAAAPEGTDPRAFGRDGEIAALFDAAGLGEIVAGALDVEVDYVDFDDFWTPFLAGEGPAGGYTASLDEGGRGTTSRGAARPAGPARRAVYAPRSAWYATGRA